MNASFRGGMQVHAVPEDERALDSRGQPLPWGYAYADASLNRKPPPVEKGPFGKPIFRQTTVGRRSTATPAPRPDNAKKSHEVALENFWGDWKKGLEEKENKTSAREQKSVTTSGTLSHARSTTNLTQTTSSGTLGSVATNTRTPTEVLLYGYGEEFQYAAIDFYESTSGGRIYEDYDRYPPNPRYNTFLTTVARQPIPSTLSPEELRMINTYQGGDHWIKITFESPEAAERACAASPHIVHGYTCYAEYWRGVGPNADVAIAGHSASTSEQDQLRQLKPTQSIQQRSWNSMPSRIHSAPNLSSEMIEMSSNSSTASSATAIATGSDAQTLRRIPEGDSQKDQATPEPTPLKIRGATRAVLHPASLALLPVAPWSQRTFGHLPLLGLLVGGDPRRQPIEDGDGGIIGNVVPRKGDGTFDWDRASWYWKICWWMDRWTGTDLCGLRGED